MSFFIVETNIDNKRALVGVAKNAEAAPALLLKLAQDYIKNKGGDEAVLEPVETPALPARAGWYLRKVNPTKYAVVQNESKVVKGYVYGVSTYLAEKPIGEFFTSETTFDGVLDKNTVEEERAKLVAEAEAVAEGYKRSIKDLGDNMEAWRLSSLDYRRVRDEALLQVEVKDAEVARLRDRLAEVADRAHKSEARALDMLEVKTKTQRELERLREQYEEVSQKIHVLHDQVATAIDQCEAKEVERAGYERALRDTEARLKAADDRLNARVNEHLSEVEYQQEYVERLVNEIQKYHDELTVARQEIRDLKSENESLDTAVNAARLDYDCSLIDMKNLRARCVTAEFNYEKLQAECSQLESTIANLEDENTRLDGANTRLLSDLNTLTTDLTAAQIAAATAETRAVMSSVRLQSAEENIVTLESALNEVQNQYAAVAGRADELVCQLEQAANDYRICEKRYNELYEIREKQLAEHADYVRCVETERQNDENRLLDLEHKFERMTEKFQHALKINVELQAKVRTLDSELVDVRGDLAFADNQNQSLVRNQEGLEREIASLRDENEKLKSKLDNCSCQRRNVPPPPPAPAQAKQNVMRYNYNNVLAELKKNLEDRASRKPALAALNQDTMQTLDELLAELNHPVEPVACFNRQPVRTVTNDGIVMLRYDVPDVQNTHFAAVPTTHVVPKPVAVSPLPSLDSIWSFRSTADNITGGVNSNNVCLGVPPPPPAFHPFPVSTPINAGRSTSTQQKISLRRIEDDSFPLLGHAHDGAIAHIGGMGRGSEDSDDDSDDSSSSRTDDDSSDDDF